MSRIHVAMAALCLTVSVSGAAAQDQLIYIGGRLDGPNDTIVAARFNDETGALSSIGPVANIARPTWLLSNPKAPVLYAVSEVGNTGDAQGGIYSLSVDKASGKLAILNRIDSGGGGATHLALDSAGKTIFVANFGTGHVADAPIGADGTLGPLASVVRNEGSGPHPRQKSAHAHQVTLDPSGRYALVADLGADKVFVYQIDATSRILKAAETPALAFPPGSGPRHTVFHPNGRFVFLSAELASEVWTLEWDAKKATLTPLSKVSSVPSDYTGTKSGGAAVLSDDGRYLYASSRGTDNAIIVYGVNADTGVLSELQRISSGGAVPWDLVFSPNRNWLLVPNESSGDISVFKRDPQSGKLTATGSKLATPHPSRVTFVN